MTNLVKTLFIFTTFTFGSVCFGYFSGGVHGAVCAFILASVVNGLIYWFSDQMILRSCHAIKFFESSIPEVYKIVSDLCKEEGMPKPKIYLIPSASPNIFATGRSPQYSSIAISKGLIELLNYEELSGVLAHEISRIKNHDALVASVVAIFIGIIDLIGQTLRTLFNFGKKNYDRANQCGLKIDFALNFFMFFAGSFVRVIIPCERKYEVDYVSAKLCGEPLYLASALLEIDRATKQMALWNIPLSVAHLFILDPFEGKRGKLFSVYPPVEERIGRLERMST